MKESKQQDPYGIFDIEEAIPRDIGPYKNLVVFSSSCLDPKFVSNSSSTPLFQKLKYVQVYFILREYYCKIWVYFGSLHLN